LLTTLVRFEERMKKKEPLLSSTTFINRFEGSFGTFGKGKKKTHYYQ